MSNPFATELFNDPMLSHTGKVGGGSKKVTKAPGASQNAAPEPREMMNPASDPFALRQDIDRARIKVSILQAKGLPADPSRAVTYGTCMAKNRKPSQFKTRDSHDLANPVWGEPGQMVVGWKGPSTDSGYTGDDLLFRIFKKDSGMMSGLMGSESLVAYCELKCSEYYPDGLQGQLPLYNAGGAAIPGAYLQVRVEVFGVKPSGFFSKITKSLSGGLTWAEIRDILNTAPETIITTFFNIIGEPADGRNKGDMLLLILAPLVCFIILTWLGWVIRHFSAPTWIFLCCAVFFASVGFMVMGLTSHKSSKTPWFSLGSLILIAVALAAWACNSAWEDSWRQWWWIHTGIRTGATASKAAESVSDAAVLNFDTVKAGEQWTSVDASRAAGFRDGDIYCAAPILDPEVASGSIMRVNYWAIGINCCDDFGSFTCDNAREYTGGTGVVMKGGGMPCHGCHADQFRLAAAKAAGVNNMVSAPGAVYVRFVSETSSIEHYYLARTMFSFVWTLLLGLGIIGFLGFLCNYKGWGKPGAFPIYHYFDHTRSIPGRARAQKDLGYIDPDKFTLVLTPAGGNANSVTASLMKP